MKKGLTFKDVLLVPQRTPLSSRGEANIKSKFTKNIHLATPFVSSNMATVTEHKMAIAMAREGGLGVIHQFGSVEEQVEEVRKVKKSTSYIIDNPVSIAPWLTVEEAIQLMQKENVTSLLVVHNDELVGIFTSKDYLFETNHKKPVSEVMTPKERLVTAPLGINREAAKKLLHDNRIEKLPLVENGKVLGLITTKDIKRLEFWPNCTRDTKGRLQVAAAIGVKDALDRARALVEVGVDCLVLDVAHAHSDLVISRLKELKKHFPIDVMVGNIATAKAAHDLIEAGADGLKIGIGPSPVCTTRVISGSGVPQFSAILDVASVAQQHNVPITADGGMKYPGDVAKAMAAGASSIYSGTFFAGTDEAPGLILMKDGKRYKKYHGSASYESSHLRRETQVGKKVKERIDVFVEGVSALVDYKGPVSDVIKSIAKGLQSGMSYCGARTITEMQEKAEFIEITASGWEESGSRGKKTSD